MCNLKENKRFWSSFSSFVYWKSLFRNVRGLWLMKFSIKTLQNLPYFWNTKINLVFFVFHFVLLNFFPKEYPGLSWHRQGYSLGGKNKVARNAKLKIYVIFIFQKYGKFWSVFLEYFIKHKCLISEEWNDIYLVHMHNYFTDTQTWTKEA